MHKRFILSAAALCFAGVAFGQTPTVTAPNQTEQVVVKKEKLPGTATVQKQTPPKVMHSKSATLAPRPAVATRKKKPQ